MRQNIENSVVVIEGVRTPFVRMGRELSDLHPADLAAANLKEALFRSELSAEDIDEVIIGNAANLPDAANIARVAALRAGLLKVSALTVHRNCASSFESAAVAFAKIKAGMIDTAAAGGAESMSMTPWLFPRRFQKFALQFRKASKLKKIQKLFKLRPSFFKPESALQAALTDPVVGLNMGQTAEILAKEFNITRKEQDDFALQSFTKADLARNKLKEEIFPVFARPDCEIIEEDDIRLLGKERLAELKPCFDKKYGTVTAGNSCPVTDGSCLLILMRERLARARNLKPLARIRSFAFCGLEPERMGLGPAYAAPKALKRAGLDFKDMDLIEINEAFSAQVLACLKALASKRFAEERLGLLRATGETDPLRLNVNGGALALGHPIAASGARLILTLSKEMKRRKSSFALAALCVGGGQSAALVLENIS